MNGRVITPSKPDLWHGTNNGGQFTVEQLNVMAARRADFEAARKRGVPSVYIVRKLTEPKTLQSLPREVRFSCPALAVTKKGDRILVITPSGLEAWEELK